MEGQNRYFTIGLAQVDRVEYEDFEKTAQENVEIVEKVTRIICTESQHPDMVVFPSMFIYSHSHKETETLYRAILKRLSELAKELHVWLLPGTMSEPGLDQAYGTHATYNSAHLFSPDGKVVAKHRKFFPFDISPEASIPGTKAPEGEKFPVVEIPGKGKVGMMICEDRLHPEVARTLAWKGAELIVDVCWGSKRYATGWHIKEILQTRAIENQCFMAFVTYPCKSDIYEACTGHSCVINPNGVVIAELDEGPCFTSVLINFEDVYQVREYGSFGGGFTILKQWAAIGPESYPPYTKGIPNGPVFKDLKLPYVTDVKDVKRHA